LQARYADNRRSLVEGAHNNVLGYFVDVTAQHGEKLLAAPAERDLQFTARRSAAGALHDHRARGTEAKMRPPPSVRSPWSSPSSTASPPWSPCAGVIKQAAEALAV